ncbi:hypothetical protein DSUL_20193 [Desulfovibrionales bacterium]
MIIVSCLVPDRDLLLIMTFHVGIL